MAPDALADWERDRLAQLRTFQESFRQPIADIEKQAPNAALRSLDEAVAIAPSEYEEYLREAVACYAGGQFRAAVLMIWAATMQHLYLKVSSHTGGLKAFEQANAARFGQSKGYRPIRKSDDLLYLKDVHFIQLGEDAGLYNRNARQLLEERLRLRNLCGHPTRYKPGREEVVIFIESLLLNVVGGSLLNW